jgi:glycerate 2-kinase
VKNQFSHSAAEQIMRAAIDRVDPVRMITDSLSLAGETLTIATEQQSLTVDLTLYDRILVLGAGKAGASMAQGLERVLGERITEGLVAVKYGHTGAAEGSGPPYGGSSPGRIRLIEAGHPVPDGESLRAAREIAALAEAADERTLCIALVSGGGSALVTLPAEGVSLEEIQVTTELLLGAGTPIGEINCVRKHLSAISGGRFCGLAAPATVVALILSDVVGDELESIASGLTAPDPTTFSDALEICRRYGIRDRLPESVGQALEGGLRGERSETPKPGDPLFDRVHPLLIGTNALALEAARVRAEALGFNTLVLTSRLTGEAREIALVFAAIGAEIVARQVPLRRPACVLAGGETTVTLRGSGTGGRNQEIALTVLGEIARRPASYSGVTFLSFGTDGNDGPTDAAGGWASGGILDASAQNMIKRGLAENDSYHVLDTLGALLRTGPTNTNVCDIQILLVE